MKIDPEEYARFAGQRMPRSHTDRNMFRAFITGGAICVLGQLIMTVYLRLGLSEELATGAESMTLIFLSALLTGLGIYDELAKFGGAGTLVPITGFANAMTAPGMEYRTEGLILGTSAKMFTVCGPVIVWGMTAGAVYGVILSVVAALKIL